MATKKAADATSKQPFSDGKAFVGTSTQATRLHTESHRICPGCGAELVDRGCKMRCLRCGFFLDCSDG